MIPLQIAAPLCGHQLRTALMVPSRSRVTPIFSAPCLTILNLPSTSSETPPTRISCLSEIATASSSAQSQNVARVACHDLVTVSRRKHPQRLRGHIVVPVGIIRAEAQILRPYHPDDLLKVARVGWFLDRL